MNIGTPSDKMDFPVIRMRRLRTRPLLRSMIRAPGIEARRLIWPIFLKPGSGVQERIQSLPDQYYFSPDNLDTALEPLIQSGVHAILLFPNIPDYTKTSDGINIIREDNIVVEAIKAIRVNYPNLIIFADLDLSEYTTHGHSGIINESGIVDNDSTLEILAKAAVMFCTAGADGVAPSGMIDGQVKYLRSALDTQSLINSLILSYSTKFASRFYSCFRDAVHNNPIYGRRADCQIPIGDTNQAIRESLLDEHESADILMVKPALSYLDIIREIRISTSCPLAAYNVSGEYAMVWYAQEHGIGNRYALAHEVLSSIFRAGADLIITYWANQINQILEYNNED